MELGVTVSPPRASGPRRYLLPALIALAGCGGGSAPPDANGLPPDAGMPPCQLWEGSLEWPDDFLTDPLVAEALRGAEIEPHRGSDPPPLAGSFCLEGRSDSGVTLESHVEISEPDGGSISYHEANKAGAADSLVGFLTGSGSNFALWVETEFRPSSAGAQAGLCAEHDAGVLNSSSVDELAFGDYAGVDEIEFEGVTVLLSGGECYEGVCPGLWVRITGQLVPPFCLGCPEWLDEESCRSHFGCEWGLVCD
jgi:hypothetical protein